MKIGVVIPSFNEEAHLSQCLQALLQAKQRVNPAIEIHILVVLDSCTDASVEILKQFNLNQFNSDQFRVNYLHCQYRCVGMTRDYGIRYLINQGIDWIACTDADTQVHQDWFLQQIQHQPVDVMCGVVEIIDWQGCSEFTRTEYLRRYQDRMNHRHIHGANLCFNVATYVRAGGFQAIACHEDVHLVEDMQRLNCNILWSNQLRVVTSSRLQARAPDGFAHFLSEIESRAC